MKVFFYVLVVCVLGLTAPAARADECAMPVIPEPPLTFDLEGLSSGKISFVGTKPTTITRVAGEPMLKIVKYTGKNPPTMEVVDGGLVVTASACSLTTPESPTEAPITEKEGSGVLMKRTYIATTSSLVAAVAFALGTADLGLLVATTTGIALAALLPSAHADSHGGDSATSTCEDVFEVEIHGPVRSAGAK